MQDLHLETVQKRGYLGPVTSLSFSHEVASLLAPFRPKSIPDIQVASAQDCGAARNVHEKMMLAANSERVGMHDVHCSHQYSLCHLAGQSY